MTVTLQQEHIKNYYIEISKDKCTALYRVALCHTVDGELYRLDKENYYTTLKAAKCRYNYIKRGLKKWKRQGFL